MPNYKRAFVPGGTWFFTVNLLQRRQNDLLIREIELLRQTVSRVKAKHPFTIDAWVVLPGHIHCVWTLPPDDADFSTRWRLIKSGFSRGLPNTEYRSKARIAAGERGIWQRHCWEHCIRDELDFQRHIDYVHVNPLKHGYVKNVITGLIRRSTVTWRKAFTPKIGAAMSIRKLKVAIEHAYDYATLIVPTALL